MGRAILLHVLYLIQGRSAFVSILPWPALKTVVEICLEYFPVMSAQPQVLTGQAGCVVYELKEERRERETVCLLFELCEMFVGVKV